MYHDPLLVAGIRAHAADAAVFSAFPLGFLRYAAASAALLVIVLTGKIRPPKKADVKWFLLSGFFGFFLYMIAFNKGCETVTSASSSVVIATVPVITALLARIVYREKMSGMRWAAMGIEFFGVVALTVLGKAFSLNRGILWLLLAAVSLSAYNLLQKKADQDVFRDAGLRYGIFAGTLMLSVFLPDAVRQVAARRRCSCFSSRSSAFFPAPSLCDLGQGHRKGGTHRVREQLHVPHARFSRRCSAFCSRGNAGRPDHRGRRGHQWRAWSCSTSAKDPRPAQPRKNARGSLKGRGFKQFWNFLTKGPAGALF